MGDSADQPNWKLLPHNPQRFFELADGYDRKDLKRSYNRWIRQFKPETHPAEFQRIRAAFESLDQDLRYGGGIGAPSSAFAAADVETWPTPQPVEISRPSQHSTAPVLALHERVAQPLLRRHRRRRLAQTDHLHLRLT